MTRDEFDALVVRRDEVKDEHERACAVLEEEGSRYASENHRECRRLYDELEQIQKQIDDEIAAERAADEASCNNP